MFFIAGYMYQVTAQEFLPAVFTAKVKSLAVALRGYICRLIDSHSTNWINSHLFIVGANINPTNPTEA